MFREGTCTVGKKISINGMIPPTPVSELSTLKKKKLVKLVSDIVYSMHMAIYCCHADIGGYSSSSFGAEIPHNRQTVILCNSIILK